MVYVQSVTEIKFNNTIQEVCDNLEQLAQAVVSAMEEIFGIPFTGNVTAVNNETVDVACGNGSVIMTNNSMNETLRRLLTVTKAPSPSPSTKSPSPSPSTKSPSPSPSSLSSTGADATVTTGSKVTAPKDNVNQKNDAVSNSNTVQGKVDQTTTLKPASVTSNTNTQAAPTNPPSSGSGSSAPIGAIIGSVVGVLVAIIAGVLCCKNRKKAAEPMAAGTTHAGAQYTQLDTLFKLPPPKTD
jgi:hypothetical protein